MFRSSFRVVVYRRLPRLDLFAAPHRGGTVRRLFQDPPRKESNSALLVICREVLEIPLLSL